MNLLAHAYLSGDNEYLFIGNFIADHIKGNQIGGLPADVVKGIHLHRSIDHYTDQHPLFNRSCNRLYSKYHKYSGVVVDILYDHFLAKEWRHYHHTPLNDYTTHCYSTLLRHYQLLPQRTRSLLPHMMMDNWLLSYASLQGMRKVFQGMSRRLKYNPGIENAVDDLLQQYEGFRKDFHEFFPDLVFFTNKKIEELHAKPVELTRRLKRQRRARRIRMIFNKKSGLLPGSEVQ